MTEKKIGKIKSVRMGRGGYQDVMLGITFTLGSGPWDVGDFWGAWSLSISAEGAQWDEADRDAAFAKTMRRIDSLLSDAQVSSTDNLVGKPIEIEFDGGIMKSWRILTEAI